MTAIVPSIRIVIIDDNSMFRDGLSNLLDAQPDFEVISSADTAPVAVEQIRKGRPDIVVLGWPASSPNSQKIYSAIQDAKLASRVIMLVSGETREDFVEAVKQGCCGIVPKQTSTELLLKSIRKVHAGEFWLDRVSTAEVIRRLAKKGGNNGPSSRLGVRDQSTALSQREREIVVLVAQGFKNKEMAERMFISEQTVKNHLHNIFDKLGVSDRLELALYAIHHNLHGSA
ncbi:MAG: two-component system, NarL family, nitrate/nitrite response regulator NarL [Bryobacterales bacterium]|nr:two-component system, NarL family, nitrate/nitrite response regulator NarL [Bryobacterales bacterium]